MSLIYRCDDYLALPRAPETWVIEQLLPSGGNLLLYGDPKVGKSYAALQLAASLATGGAWLGFGLPQCVRVAYVQLDTPRSLWADRVERLKKESLPELEAVWLTDRETIGAHPFNVALPEHFTKLQELVNVSKADVTILDTIRQFHAADEDKSSAMEPVIARLEAAVNPSALVLVAHARKPNADQGPDVINDARGSNAVVARMDGIVRFTKYTMRVAGRSIEEHTIKLNRADDYTWSVADDPLKNTAQDLLTRMPEVPTRELARVLHATFPDKSEETCRGILRRLKDA